MKRLRGKLQHQPCGHTTWHRCDFCGKVKPESVMLSAGDGQRFYCNERELDRAEKAHTYQRG